MGFCFSGRYDGDVEHELIAHLFKGYNSNARPVFNKSTAVFVKLDIAYSQLVDLVSTVNQGFLNSVLVIGCAKC